MKNPEAKQGTILGGALLVAGTTIGGGMLALPVLTSPGGFFPSLLIYLICWLFMTLTGLLFLELSLHMEDGVNIVTMAERTLGRYGKIAAWGLYLFLFYCLTLAYIVGCGDILNTLLQDRFPHFLGPMLFLALSAPFLYAGPWLVGKLNYYLMGALGLCFVLFVFIGLPAVETANLAHHDWSLSLLALPIAFISFAYQGIIPTLTTYLRHDKKKLVASIWLGSLIPLITYILWQGLILGIIPFHGPDGLQEALKEGRNAVYPLKNHLDIPHIFVLGQCFAFFALLTSFFGVTLGLMDFLADGLQIKKTPLGKIFLTGLICIPPFFIAILYPDIFLQALDVAGGYGSALLLGLLPILMAGVWRYKHLKSKPLVKGGYAVLVLLALFVLFEVFLEIHKLFS